MPHSLGLSTCQPLADGNRSKSQRTLTVFLHRAKGIPKIRPRAFPVLSQRQSLLMPTKLVAMAMKARKFQTFPCEDLLI